jgi:hypothetical protein
MIKILLILEMLFKSLDTYTLPAYKNWLIDQLLPEAQFV